MEKKEQISPSIVVRSISPHIFGPSSINLSIISFSPAEHIYKQYKDVITTMRAFVMREQSNLLVS